MKNFNYYLEQAEAEKTKTETDSVDVKEVLNAPDVDEEKFTGDDDENQFRVNGIDTENNKIVIQNIKTGKTKAIDLLDSMKDLQENTLVTEIKENDTYVYLPYIPVDPKSIGEIEDK